jgi:hypothetical protein
VAKRETFPVRVTRYGVFDGMENNAERFAELKVGAFRFPRKLYVRCEVKDRRTPFIRKTVNWTRKWGECKVSIRRPPRFPHEEEFNVGSVQLRTELDKALAGTDWFYEKERVEFHTYDEVGVFGLAWAAFNVLRKANAIPGRLTKTGMARKAIEWLKEYRQWREAGFPDEFVKPEPPKPEKKKEKATADG